jgi:hypothetical protein
MELKRVVRAFHDMVHRNILSKIIHSKVEDVIVVSNRQKTMSGRVEDLLYSSS